MFFGIDWLAALIKISFQIVFSFVTAIPVCYAWAKVIPKYFSSYIPEIFYNIPFWDMVCILFLISICGEYIKKLIPTIVKISQSQTNT